MMTLFSAFLFPVPFSGWVSSIKRYWVILAKRRRTIKTRQFALDARLSDHIHALGFERNTNTEVSDEWQLSQALACAR